MTSKLAYRQIVEERKIFYKERFRMLERWEEAGWIVCNDLTVELPHKKPPYEDDDCPISMGENDK